MPENSLPFDDTIEVVPSPKKQPYEKLSHRKPSQETERALDEGPLFLLLRRLTSRPNNNRFVRDTHRESGVISFLALLSPVDSCNPPELEELTTCLYARGTQGTSEKNKKIRVKLCRLFSGDCVVDFPESGDERK